MKKRLLAILAAITSTSALAHPGHLPDESVHGFLHIEHIILLIAVGAVAITIIELRKR